MLRLLFTLLILYPLGVVSLQAQVESLSDEFDVTSNILFWQNITESEGWYAEHLEVFDIDSSTAGTLHMMPYTTSWYEDYRGPLIFKEIAGDFVFTTEVSITSRSESGLPTSTFSLGGVMLRTPRNITNGLTDWLPGGENYIFLSTGYAHQTLSDPPSTGPHFEAKTTINSQSTLVITPIDTCEHVQIRLVRVGEHILSLYRLPGSDWQIRARYTRQDFPDTMQVGLVTYTDWPKLSSFTETYANSNILNSTANSDSSSNPGLAYNPDLIGRFDFARFTAVNLPVALTGANLSNPMSVSDSTILIHFGYPSQPFIEDNIHYHLDTLGIVIRKDETNDFINISGQLENYQILAVDSAQFPIDAFNNQLPVITIEKSVIPDSTWFLDIRHAVHDSLYLLRFMNGQQ